MREEIELKRHYPTQPIVGVGAVIVCNRKILLVKRKGEPGKGKWTIPGGLVELGEAAEQTVIREVNEETTLQVEQPKLIDVVSNITVDFKGRIEYHFVILDYFVKIKGEMLEVGTLKAADDAEELRWVGFEQVESYDLTESFRQFFQRNRRRLENLNSRPENEQAMDLTCS